VLDLAGQAPTRAHEIPDLHRRAVRLMTPGDVIPFGGCTRQSVQVDHTVPSHPGERGQPRAPGQRMIGNYGPLTTLHHRIKTFGGRQVQ
jgi:hypothetical protein